MSDALRELLAMQTWAVVGLSANPQRPSYGVARFLQAHGVRVIPVNPNCGASVLGERAYCALADIPDPVDVVDVFRRSEAASARRGGGDQRPRRVVPARRGRPRRLRTGAGGWIRPGHGPLSGDRVAGARSSLTGGGVAGRAGG